MFLDVSMLVPDGDLNIFELWIQSFDYDILYIIIWEESGTLILDNTYQYL